MPRTHVILDGMQDPELARRLSRAWAETGISNAVDPAGQCGWVDVGEEKNAKPQAAVAEVGRGFGLEARDRVGEMFKAENDLAALRERLVYEYKSRLATALMFGVPALAIHYLGPMLATGGGQDARAMFYPWLFELLLVGWACVAAGWPILWQGGLSLVHLRATGDLLTTLIIATAFVPSAVGVASLMIADEPWLSPPGAHGGPMFHAALFAVLLAVLQRYLAHRAAPRLSGRAMLMLTGHRRLVALWGLASLIVGVFMGWRMGLATALLLPPMMSHGAINPWSPGWSAVLPVIAFALFLVLGPRALELKASGYWVEIAFGFGAMMTGVFALGWPGMTNDETRMTNQIPNSNDE